MKRFLIMIAVISMTLVTEAQNQIATLSHLGELKSFEGMYALADALGTAQDGDTIFLSEGEFMHRGIASDPISIVKRVSIIGCGYNSHIIPRVYINHSRFSAWNGSKAANFDGVRINHLDFDSSWSTIGKLRYFSIKNSWINNITNCGYAGNEYYIDGCLIDTMSFDRSTEYMYVTNSKIGTISDVSQYFYVTNCNIKKATSLPNTVISSIIESYGQTDDWYHTVDNSLFPENNFKGSVQSHDCYFDNPADGLLDENLNATIDLKAKGYIGKDGKIIGAYGGEFPFSEYPSVPTIDSTNSSVEFDADSNKLNVTITLVQN